MKKIIENFFYQTSYQILNILLPIITVPIVSRALGPEGIGVWNYTYSILNYFYIVAALGLANYGTRSIAVVRDDKEKLSKTFWEIEFFNIFFGTVTIIIYIFFVLNMEYKHVFLAQTFILFGSILDISWFYSGTENFKNITLVNTVLRIVSFILIVLFINDSSDFMIYVWIQVLTIFFGHGLLWLFLANKIVIHKVNFKGIISHLKPALTFFFAQAGMTIYLNLNKTILGIMTTMSVVGFFSNSLTLITLSGTIITSLNTVLIPKMSKLYGDKKEQRLLEVLGTTIHFQLFITIPMMFGIWIINEQFISWFFGPDFIVIKNIVYALSPYLIFNALHAGIAAQYLIPKNEMYRYNLSIVLGAVFSLIANITLIPLVGIYGAVIASVGSQMLICFVRCYTLLKQTTFIFDWKLISKFLLSAFIMWAVVSLLTKDMPSSIITTLIQIVMGVVIYLLFTSIFKSNQLLFVIKNLDLKIFNKNRRMR